MAKIEIANPIVPIELNFINKYLPEAHPTHVMVYIYALGLCYSNKQSDNASIAESLDILESDVIKAWKYWVKKGLVSLGLDGTVTFLSTNHAEAPTEEKEAPREKETVPVRPVEIAPDVIAKPVKRSISMAEITAKMEIDKSFSNMLKMAQLIWEKPFTQTEIKALYSFMEWYSFSDEVLTLLVEYCALEEKTKNVKYMEAVAEAWAQDGITTIKMAAKVFNKKQKEVSMLKKCVQIFGLSRAFSDKEVQYITEWTTILSMSEAMIKEAYNRTTTNTGKLSFQYMNKILTSWSSEGIKTLTALKEAEAVRKAPSKGQGKSSSNYDFDEIERLELERLMKDND